MRSPGCTFSFHIHKRFPRVSHDTDEIWHSRCWRMWKRSALAVTAAAVRVELVSGGNGCKREFDA